MDKKDKYAEAAMRWYGWGSPIGLGLFLIALSLVALIGTLVLSNLTETGQKGISLKQQIEEQERLEEMKLER